VIQSPPIPDKTYNPEQDTFCVWNIAAPPGTYVRLNFTTFQSEALYDRLLIFRPREACSLESQLTGVGWPIGPSHSLLVNTNAVSLYFLADGSLTYRGFQLSWESLTPESTAALSSTGPPRLAAAAAAECGSVLSSFLRPPGESSFVRNCGLDVGEETGGSSIVTFGPINNNNNNNSSKFCSWNILAPEGSTVSLTVMSFRLNATASDKLFLLEPAPACGYAAAGGYLTGEILPGKVIATGRRAVLLYYYSPAPAAGETYSTERGFSLFAGFVKNPRRTLSKVEKNAITVGGDQCAAAITKYLPRQRPSIGARAADLTPNCGTDEVNSGGGGVITSPGYPANYSNNLRCRWTVYAPGATHIRVVAEVTEVEANWDRLFLLRPAHQGCRPLDRVGEHDAENIFVDRNTTLELRDGDAFSVYFYSDETVTAPGFRIFWHVISGV
jgi:hypothetical protein